LVFKVKESSLLVGIWKESSPLVGICEHWTGGTSFPISLGFWSPGPRFISSRLGRKKTRRIAAVKNHKKQLILLAYANLIENNVLLNIK
jgi:hypothetical protein